MWVDYKKAPNLMLAEAWKEILEGEGLPVRLLPQTDITDSKEILFKVSNILDCESDTICEIPK